MSARHLFSRRFVSVAVTAFLGVWGYAARVEASDTGEVAVASDCEQCGGADVVAQYTDALLGFTFGLRQPVSLACDYPETSGTVVIDADSLGGPREGHPGRWISLRADGGGDWDYCAPSVFGSWVLPVDQSGEAGQAPSPTVVFDVWDLEGAPGLDWAQSGRQFWHTCDFTPTLEASTREGLVSAIVLDPSGTCTADDPDPRSEEVDLCLWKRVNETKTVAGLNVPTNYSGSVNAVATYSFSTRCYDDPNTQNQKENATTSINSLTLSLSRAFVEDGKNFRDVKVDAVFIYLVGAYTSQLPVDNQCSQVSYTKLSLAQAKVDSRSGEVVGFDATTYSAPEWFAVGGNGNATGGPCEQKAIYLTVFWTGEFLNEETGAWVVESRNSAPVEIDRLPTAVPCCSISSPTG